MIFLVITGFLLFIGLFALGARYGTQYAGKILGDRINRVHHAVEYVLEHEKIPPEWRPDNGPPPGREQRWERRQKRRALRRLGKLITYLQGTPTFTDVESREYVVGEINRIRTLWQGSEYSAITAPPGDSENPAN